MTVERKPALKRRAELHPVEALASAIEASETAAAPAPVTAAGTEGGLSVPGHRFRLDPWAVFCHLLSGHTSRIPS